MFVLMIEQTFIDNYQSNNFCPIVFQQVPTESYESIRWTYKTISEADHPE